ncbi:MAG: cytochrome c [Ramlibacter sp.]|nr:cytochrome c [Ramlibacter sp.]
MAWTCLRAFFTTALCALACAGATAQSKPPATVPAADPAPTPASASVPDPRDAAVVRGEYLARAGDCISCHTRPGGAPFAGGLPMKTPFGTIISTNITPEPQQGIGQYTQEDFTRALREGRARDGHHLYPAMPYTSFSRLSDADLQALYAYFMKGVPPARQDNPVTDLAWPFSMRGLMALWNWRYLPDKPFEADPARSAQWNRGAYLVQGLGHCGACHTPRSFTGAEKARSEQGGEAFLSGAVIDGWYAQPLRNSVTPGLATWSTTEIVDYLKTGRTARTAAFGPMTQVVSNSTQHLSREDLGAIAGYLKSIGGEGDAAVIAPPAATDATAAALRQGETTKPGSLVFLNNCAACHRTDGEGARRTFPSLAHNSAVAASDPTSLIRIVLQGSAMARTAEAPSQLAMPALGWRLTDANVADVLSFMRSSWGNRAAPVTPEQVARVRADVQAAAKGAAR